MKNTIMSLIVLTAVSIQVHAQQKVAPDKLDVPIDPVAKTQQVLTDPNQRAAALDTPQAKAAAQNVTALSMGNPEIANKIFGVSADLFQAVADWQSSDPDFFKKLAENSQDPAFIKKFYEKIPASSRAKIKEIAAQIESGNPSVKSNP